MANLYFNDSVSQDSDCGNAANWFTGSFTGTAAGRSPVLADHVYFSGNYGTGAIYSNSADPYSFYCSYASFSGSFNNALDSNIWGFDVAGNVDFYDTSINNAYLYATISGSSFNYHDYSSVGSNGGNYGNASIGDSTYHYYDNSICNGGSNLGQAYIHSPNPNVYMPCNFYDYYGDPNYSTAFFPLYIGYGPQYTGEAGDGDYSNDANWRNSSGSGLGRLPYASETIIINNLNPNSSQGSTLTLDSGNNASSTGCNYAYVVASDLGISLKTSSGCVFLGGCVNQGTVIGSSGAVFKDVCSNQGTGTIRGTSQFYSNSSNYGAACTLSGTASFHDSSFNEGTIGTNSFAANAQFRDYSINNSASVVYGSAIFQESSQNLGQVNGNATVYFPVTRPIGGTVLGIITYIGYGGTVVAGLMLLALPFPVNYIVSGRKPFSLSALLKMPFPVKV
jgi:hypothetical protein